MDLLNVPPVMPTAKVRTLIDGGGDDSMTFVETPPRGNFGELQEGFFVAQHLGRVLHCMLSVLSSLPKRPVRPRVYQRSFSRMLI